MKVISGFLKGRNIEGYNIAGTRPTQDRVKESMMASIQNHIKDAIVLDLFAGSGQLGIETISNGARLCYFIDNNSEVINILKKTITKFQIQEKSNIINSDWKKALNTFGSSNNKFDIIFVDPPYDYDVYEKIITKINELDLLNKNGILVLEYTNKNFKDQYDNLILIKEKNTDLKASVFIKKGVLMKNKKKGGFSLIEILAIIIVLTLIVLIVVPKIMNTIYDSKNNSMGITLESTEKWFEKQDLLSNSGLYITYMDIYPELIENVDVSGAVIYNNKELDISKKEIYKRQIQTLELSEKDVSQVYAYLFSSGKVCIVISKIPETSKYYNIKYWEKDELGEATPKQDADTKYYSNGCDYSPIPREQLLNIQY